MSRIDKYLKELESQRRSKPVTHEQWQEWEQHPMTQIFFLDLDISHVQLLQEYPDTPEFQAGRRMAIEDVLDYEPQELIDYEGETND